MPVVCAARGYEGLGASATRGVCRRLLVLCLCVCLNWSNANLVYVRSPPGDMHVVYSYDARYAYTSGSASVSVSDQTALLHCMLLY